MSVLDGELIKAIDIERNERRCLARFAEEKTSFIENTNTPPERAGRSYVETA